MRRPLRRSILVVALAVSITAAGLWAAVGEATASTVASGSGYTLLRTSSGILAHRGFTRSSSDRRLQDSFEFDGSASPSYAYVRDPGGGLQVGVRSHRYYRAFKGWFAVTLAAFPASSVFHVKMARPPGNVESPGSGAETVFAVQTASTKVTGLINFVEVTSASTAGSTAWQVDYSHGYIRNAKSQLYWIGPQSSHASLSEEITVRTDGHHRLAVWFGNRLVFSSSHLHMHMKAPFQPYLEVQSQKVPYFSTFTDFWVTRTASLAVAGLPAGAQVSLRPAGAVAASPATVSEIAAAKASAAGVATLHLPPPLAKGRASLVVTPPGGGRPLRLGPFDYAGGDRFQLRHAS